VKGKKFIKFLQIFFSAFLINFVWEVLHSVLYERAAGVLIEDISRATYNLILFRASIMDALIIVVIIAIYFTIPFLRTRSWTVLVIGIIWAIVLETHALGTGRWAYDTTMPIIPLINTGLTPTIQLGLIAYGLLKVLKLEKLQLIDV
jgi:hypothetical protein